MQDYCGHIVKVHINEGIQYMYVQEQFSEGVYLSVLLSKEQDGLYASCVSQGCIDILCDMLYLTVPEDFVDAIDIGANRMELHSKIYHKMFDEKSKPP